MGRSLGLQLSALKVSELRLIAYRNELIAAKLEFLLWGWNWVCAAMVQEWHDGRASKAEGLRGNPAIWTIEDWAKILGPCAREDGDYTFDNNSVKMTRAKEKTFAPLFKKSRSCKNGYQTTKYGDRMRRNVAMALMQILWPSRTTYMVTWKVGFVEHTVAGKSIHWARIL